MQNRRDFLKLLGLAVGASLSGCGGGGSSLSGGGGGGIGPAPISYQFVPLVKSGQALPQSKGTFGAAGSGEPPFLGAVCINDQRHIAFHAADQAEKRGIYRIDVSSSGQLSNIKSIIREGDVLPDGTVVDEFSEGEMNNSDDFVVQVESPEGVESLQYSSKGGAFQKLAQSYQELSGNAKLSGSICQCQALSDDGRILFVAEYMDDEAGGDGLFYMPADNTGEARLILANDQLLPGSTASIQTFGVSELGIGGHYLVQGSATPTDGGSSATSDGTPLTYLLTGTVGENPQLLAAHPSLGITTEGVLPASIFMCPRMSDSAVAAILQLDESRTQLRLNQELLLEADQTNGGSLSPRGSRIISMFPPAFGPGGVMFLQLFTKDGIEIVVYDGVRFRTILGRGDRINGKIVEDIMFGALPEAVNSRGELVAVVVYSDGETVVLLGLPV